MAHNPRIRADLAAWTAHVPVDPAEFEALDQAQFKSINGDDGGSWDPAAFISIGGAGLELRGLNHEIANGGALTVTNNGIIFLDSGGYITVNDGGVISLIGDGGSLNYAIVTTAGAGIKIEGAPAAHGTLYMGAQSDADWHLNSTATWMNGSTATWALGSTSTWASGAVFVLNTTTSGTGAIYLEKVGSAANHFTLDGEGLAITGIVGDHGTLELIDYVDLEIDNHATALWKWGSTLDTAAGAVATFAGTTSFTGATSCTGALTLGAGSAPALQDRMTLSGAGQVVNRSLRVITDADFTMNTQQYDHYWVDNATLSAPRVWTLPAVHTTTAPEGARLYVSTEETTHTVTIHSSWGIAENWVMQKATGQICGMLFISVWDGASQRWHPIAKYVEP